MLPLACVLYCYIILGYIMGKVTAPQDAHGSLGLQVYFGSNTLEFSAIRSKIFVVDFRESAT